MSDKWAKSSSTFLEDLEAGLKAITSASRKHTKITFICPICLETVVDYNLSDHFETHKNEAS